MTKRQQKRFSLLLIFIVLLSVILLFVACPGRKHKAVSQRDDLRGAVIGVQLGTIGDTRVTPLESDGSGTRVERYNKTGDAIQALLQGKVDAVVVDEQPAKAFVAQNPTLRILPQAYGKEEYAFCVAKEQPQLAQRINTAITQLRADGTLERIVNDHLQGGMHVAYSPKNTSGPVLTIATNATFRPYEYYEGGNIVGIDIDIMRAIADQLGMQTEVEDMEFDAVITSVQTGKTDVGAAGLTVTPDRARNITFTIPYATTRQMIVVAQNGAAAVSGQGIGEKFRANFITDSRYLYLVQGLGNTLLIAFFAMIISMLLGTCIAIVRFTHDTTGALGFFNALARLFLMVIRGTPTMVQLLIIYYVVFASADVSKVLVAIVAFGVNSSAYLAEVIRSGLVAVDRGQMEAGRSLGLTHTQTLTHILLPQAFRNVLPAMGNEFITMLKETSISGYIGLADLTKGSDIIRSLTYDAIMPLGVVALIYFILVAVLSSGVSRLEKHLAKHDK